MTCGHLWPFPLQSPQWSLEGRKGAKEHQPLGLHVSLVYVLVLGSGASRHGENKSPPPAQEQDRAPGAQVLVSQAHVTCHDFIHFPFITATECGRCPDFTCPPGLLPLPSRHLSWRPAAPVLQTCCLLHRALPSLDGGQPGGAGPVRAVHHQSGNSGVIRPRAGHPLPPGEGSTAIANGNVQKIPTDSHKKHTVWVKLCPLANATLRKGQ